MGSYTRQRTGRIPIPQRDDELEGDNTWLDESDDSELEREINCGAPCRPQWAATLLTIQRLQQDKAIRAITARILATTPT